MGGRERYFKRIYGRVIFRLSEGHCKSVFYGWGFMVYDFVVWLRELDLRNCPMGKVLEGVLGLGMRESFEGMKKRMFE